MAIMVLPKRDYSAALMRADCGELWAGAGKYRHISPIFNFFGEFDCDRRAKIGIDAS
jgi:hypothetical protein